MDQQKEPALDMEQRKEELQSAKARLAEQAEQLSLKEYMVKHPYITLGAAFFSGVLAGGSHAVLDEMAQAVVGAVSKDLFSRGKQ